MELTARQTEILRLIRDRIEENGMPPTRAEIATEFGFSSPNAAESHLRALARKGAIELIPGSSRGIRLKEVPGGLPVVGRVAAGHPILATEHIETSYRIDPQLFRPRADYLLRVKGMSMQGAGILDGDLLVVHRTPEARDGQIVVARLGDEVTVKRLKRKGRQILLLPENPAFEAIKVSASQDNFAIEGIGVGILRNGELN